MGRRADQLEPLACSPRITMQELLQDLFRMFYPLSKAEQRRWAALLSLSEEEYVSALESEALKRGLQQSVVDGAVAWLDRDGHQLMLLFRVPDPRDLGAVRGVYDTISENEAPWRTRSFTKPQTGGARGTFSTCRSSRISPTVIEFLGPALNVRGEQANQRVELPGARDGRFPANAGASGEQRTWTVFSALEGVFQAAPREGSCRGFAQRVPL